MGKYQIVYGRNVLVEAIACGVQIGEVFCEGKSEQAFVQNVAPELRTKQGMPRSLGSVSHQGVAFEMMHSFYQSPPTKEEWQNYPSVLFCNHLEDVHNLGAISRSAAAFGFSIIVHEESRSFSMNAAALKVSMGQAFRIRFLQVSNLVPLVRKLRDLDFEFVGLEGSSPHSLYGWKPAERSVMVVGGESSGISRPLSKALDFPLSIPMAEGVESLNASQAASIAMGWAFARRGSDAFS